ncbi:keratin, type II cuticular Hb1-like [Erinaceus europaeus]|uniref:Keratin, type II cuticular Hb1-like n=1 Tax=Erinaceus europaeus TaxID=9365 RepID=A0ABM3XR53_ERIEU|nr:keratin, type II cuticular Hb1-like [Erinaceus europaeus]
MDIEATVQKCRQPLRHSKEELNRLNQAIQQLTLELDSTKSQPGELERAKDPPAVQEEGDSGSAKCKLAWLEAALQRAKQVMVRQLCEYQELMMVKLGLDLEIATYKRLLEGQESRTGLGCGAGKFTLGSVQPGSPPACSCPWRVSVPWERAPLAATACTTAPGTVSGTTTSVEEVEECFLSYPAEVKKH